MRYSVFAGGKRLRPLLVLLAARAMHAGMSILEPILVKAGVKMIGTAKEARMASAIFAGSCDSATAVLSSTETRMNARPRTKSGCARAGGRANRIWLARARRRRAQRRGECAEKVELEGLEIPMEMGDDQLLALHEALDRLAARDPAKAELVKLRFFVGLTLEEAAEVLGVSVGTAKRHWAYARAWLYRVAHNCAVDHVRREVRRSRLHERHSAEQTGWAPPDRGAGFRVSEAAERAGYVPRDARSPGDRAREIEQEPGRTRAFQHGAEHGEQDLRRPAAGGPLGAHGRRRGRRGRAADRQHLRAGGPPPASVLREVP